MSDANEFTLWNKWGESEFSKHEFKKANDNLALKQATFLTLSQFVTDYWVFLLRADDESSGGDWLFSQK